MHLCDARKGFAIEESVRSDEGARSKPSKGHVVIEEVLAKLQGGAEVGLVVCYVGPATHGKAGWR